MYAPLPRPCAGPRMPYVHVRPSAALPRSWPPCRGNADLANIRDQQGADLAAWLHTVRGGRSLILTGDFNGLPSEQFYSNLTQSSTLPLVSSYKVTGEEKGER